MPEVALRIIPVRQELLPIETPSFRLQPDEALAEGLSRVGADQLRYARRALEQLPVGIGVHEARKSIRRVRAALRLTRDSVGDEVFRQDDATLRDLGRELGPARDAAVLLQTFDNLAVQYPTALGGDLAGLRVALAERRSTLELEIEEKAKPDVLLSLGPLGEGAVRSFALLDRTVTPVVSDDFATIARGIRRVYRQGRRRMEDALSNPTIATFHIWRNRVRYLRYQVDLISESSSHLAHGLAPDLAELAVGLGTEHDLAVLSEVVHRQSDLIPEEGSRGRLLDFLESYRLNLRRLLEPIGKRVFREAPGKFIDSLATYWESWKSQVG